jgi:hypothetical protein
VKEFFTNRVFTPGSVPFTVNVELNLPPGTGTGGTAVVQVTGTDANGGMVDVSSDTLVVTDSNTKKPAFSCVPNANTLCLLPGGRFQVNVNWADFNGNTGPGMVTDGQRFSDGGWFRFSGLSDPVNPNGFDASSGYSTDATPMATSGYFWTGRRTSRSRSPSPTPRRTRRGFTPTRSAIPLRRSPTHRPL